ncbi:hypothetical protein [Stieleria varia]|uniref:Uncharacterized protein n=1 Tax=Stieleria varia TaxID=2528005 RepID=A0A5C6A265_9BACT|nr:hypothetical protein [Stieleria varia]TWT93321.1 hypothetical protein Pla52n_59810 [Stieleria varia]
MRARPGRSRVADRGVWYVFDRMVVFVFDLESRTTIVARLSKSIACPAKRFAIPNR